FTRCIPLSAASCLSLVGQILPDLTAAASAGRIKIDDSKVQACADALGGLSCAVVHGVGGGAPQECLDALVGTVVVGGDCYDSFDCQKGSCNLVSAAGLVCPGKCVAYVAEGGDCTKGGICDPATTNICNF